MAYPKDLNIPDIIPGLEEGDPELFSSWLDSKPDIFYRGLLSDKVLQSPSLECKFIYSVWLFSSLTENHKPMIKNALSSFHLAQIFWDNLHLSNNFSFVQQIIKKNGGLISFIINVQTNKEFNEQKIRANFFRQYLTNLNIIENHDLEYNFSKDSNDFLEILPINLQLSILKNSKKPEDRVKGYKSIAIKYLNEEIKLDNKDLDILVKEINSPNFTNLIRDNIFITFCSFRNRINGINDPSIFLFHPEKDMFSVLGIKNKRLKKQFYIKGKNKEINLNMISVFPKIEDAQQQELLIKITENYDEEKVPLFFTEIFDNLIVKGILKNTRDEIDFANQSLKLDPQLVNDTVFMLRKMNQRRRYDLNNNESQFIKAFKDKNKFDLKKVHDWLSEKVKMGNSVVLNQDHIQKIDGKKVEEFLVVVPKDNAEFVAVGNHLKICVGNGSYLDKVLTRKSMIFFLKKDDEINFCIEISYNFEIIQAKGFRNSEMPSSTLKKLKSLINKELHEKSYLSIIKYIKSFLQP